MPERAHPTDAGADLKCKESTHMPKGERVLVRTGVRTAIPACYVGLLFPRSSLSKLGITMTNSVGVIDSDYRGEIMASLKYDGPEDSYYMPKGTKIVQLVIVPCLLDQFITVETLSETERGEGGFGSTG